MTCLLISYSEKLLNRENRREFFDSVAQHENFDPLVAANWINMDESVLKKYKVSKLNSDDTLF